MSNELSRPCAYCGIVAGALTREHIFPAALDREFSKDIKDPQMMKNPYWIDRLEEKMVGKEPAIKDVCKTCNNEILSRLDGYGLELYRKYFFRIAAIGDKVVFEYDYDRLLRWLLKLNFNSARVNKAADLESLHKLRWYILEKKTRPKRIALYLTLIYRHEIPDDVKAEAARKNIEISPTHEPDMLRIGHFEVNHPAWNPLISRTAIFQSFFYSMIMIGDKQPAFELERLGKEFLRVCPKAVLLKPSQTRVSVQASLSSNDAIETHILKNQSYYSRKFPEIWDEQH